MSAESPTVEKKQDVKHLETTDVLALVQDMPRLANLHELSPAEAARAADKIREVRNAAYEAAIASSPINWKSKSSITLFYTAFITLLGACTNGYDGSLFSGISPMFQYQDYFKTGTVGGKVSLIFSMYTVGSFVGAFVAGPVADRWGRRMGMCVGGGVIFIGTVIVSTARVFEQLIGGRFVLGMGIAIVTVGAPSLCVEIAPPHWRGKFVGVYNSGWNGGLALMCLSWTCLESPRWMMQNGRSEEAYQWLVKYHGNGDPNSALVKLEFQEFQDHISLDGIDKRWWDYRALFRTKNARWRMVMVLMISVFGQYAGNGLGYFQNVIYNNLGYTSPRTILALNLGGSFLGAICSLTAASLTDRMPRVKVLTIGTALLSLCLLGNGLSSTFWAKQPVDASGTPINPNLAIGQAGVAFNFLFGVVYSFTYTPLQGVYPTENLETTARAKGLAISGVIVSLVGFINTYAGPYALQNMKNNYIYVFVGLDIVFAACWYFFGVGKSNLFRVPKVPEGGR